MKQVTAEVISNKKVLGELERPDAQTSRRPDARNTLGSCLMWLECPEIASSARPGQYVMVRCGDDCYLPRPLSVHKVDRGSIAIFFAVWEEGKGTGWLYRRRKGDRIGLIGPLGNGFSIHPDSHNLLLVAGGTGIAPLCFLAEEAVKKGQSVKMLRGASGEYKPSGQKNPPQHYPKRLLPKGIEVQTVTTSPDGREGMAVDLLTPEIVDWADQVFACGPAGMYRAMARMPELKGKSVQVSLEIAMACGVGVCLSCTIKTRSGLKQVCKDGPVFNLEDIIWEEMGE